VWFIVHNRSHLRTDQINISNPVLCMLTVHTDLSHILRKCTVYPMLTPITQSNDKSHRKDSVQSAKYEFASSNTTGTTFAFNACFVCKLAPLADERNSIFYRMSIATIHTIERVFNVANSYLAYSIPNACSNHAKSREIT
jgi:hypothetical protein